MKNIWALGDFVAMAALVVGFCYVSYSDLSQPEIWDESPIHDPRFYLPLVAVVIPLSVWVWRRERRKAKQRAGMYEMLAREVRLTTQVLEEKLKQSRNKQKECTMCDVCLIALCFLAACAGTVFANLTLGMVFWAFTRIGAKGGNE